MGALASVRGHLATALAGLSVPVHAYPEGSVQPPCVILVPGSPYVDLSTSFGGRTVAIDVRIVVNDSAGSATTAALDDLIDAVITALKGVDVAVGSISAPMPDRDQGAIVCEVPTTTVWVDD